MQTLSCVVLVCTFLAACQANSLVKDDASNIRVCPKPNLAVTLLADEPVYEKVGILQVKKRIYKFPLNGVNTKVINCIIVQDKSNDGSGATVKIISGGYNQYHIELEFTSKRGKDINSHVELYGPQ